MSTSQWIKEAEEQAKKYSEAIKTNNQYIIDQLNASKSNTLEQLQKQQNNALYNLNSQKSNIYNTAEDNAGQAYINKVLALKDNEQAMNRAGLGTQGIVGSQVNNINNSYGKNINDILNNRTSSLNELEKNKMDTSTTYDTNRLNLENEYGLNIANAQKSINDSALNQYNNVYNNVLALKQQEYDNQQKELATAEAIRQFNENQAESIRQFNLQHSSNNNTSGNKRYDEFNDSHFESDSYGNSLNTTQLDDYYFTSATGEHYQPRYIGDTKLSQATKNNTKLVMSDVYGDTDGYSDRYLRKGVGMNYKIWKANNNYYVWTGEQNGKYIDITDDVNSYLKTNKWIKF